MKQSENTSKLGYFLLGSWFISSTENQYVDTNIRPREMIPVEKDTSKLIWDIRERNKRQAHNKHKQTNGKQFTTRTQLILILKVPNAVTILNNVTDKHFG